ncbi:MAG: hypothetical protein GEV07_28005 [Streptosporangiales bacterium]|nr:hypothetical protein [Streptosporangiales bacterium]
MTVDPPVTPFQSLAGEPDPFGDLPHGKPYQAEVPLTAFSSEREMADRVLARLPPWFTIQREVTGQHCSGRRLRIDAIIRPRQAHLWRNPNVALGVEFKMVPKCASIGDYTRWIAQAVDYTHVEWPGHGRLMILTCPGAASWLGAGIDHDSRAVMVARRLAGQLGVGELVLRWSYGLALLLNGEHVWSERHGISRGQHWGLTLKSGSR